MESTSTLLPPFFLLLLTLTSLLPTITTTTTTSTTTTTALNALKSALHGRWNTTSTNPCTWQGVHCNSQGHVIELHLPGLELFGSLPNSIFSNLTSLTFLSLRFNSLSKTLPSDFSSLINLKFLYLQHNRFSGQIPNVLFSISTLIRVDLSGNLFSGRIPLGFGNLKNLDTLYLEDNQLNGSIPSLKNPNLKQFNVSHNLLTGFIPVQFCGLPSNAFEGNSLTPCSNNGNNNNHNDNNKNKKLSSGLLAGIIIASIVAFIVILVLIFFLCCRKNRKRDPQSGTRSADVASSSNAIATNTNDGGGGGGGGGGRVDKTLVFIGKGFRVFDLDDLLRASAEVLGKGNYGTTYKAAVDKGVEVAVKRLKDVNVTEKEFREKMEEIGKLEYDNLVSLRAYHCSANEKLLVYDYFPMGSLSALLHGNRGSGRSPLNWETRSAIALGTARAITYIHSQNPTSSHGNIKSCNILLTDSYEARVSDWGLSQLAIPSATSNRVAGYRAPEITDPQKVSQKGDVYSFGILLLELITGKSPTHALFNEEGFDLPRWVQSVVREEWASEVFDVELLRYQNVEEEMVQLLQLGIDCTAQYPDSRPLMADVTGRIDEICRASSANGQDNFVDVTSE